MRTAPALLIVSLTLLLSGCIPDDDPVIPDPVPSATPIFASDEEALAAAGEAYGEYVAMTDLILADGGEDPARLLEVVTEAVYEQELPGIKDWAAQGLSSEGASTFDSVVLQSYDPSSDGPSIVSIYACHDVSTVDVLDANGASVVSADRPSRTPFEVVFDFVGTTGTLIVSSKQVWSGEDFCL